MYLQVTLTFKAIVQVIEQQTVLHIYKLGATRVPAQTWLDGWTVTDFSWIRTQNPQVH